MMKTIRVLCLELFCVLSLQTRHPQTRDESFLRQVQRSYLREAGEARHHDPPHQPSEHSPGAGRTQRVSVCLNQPSEHSPGAGRTQRVSV